MTSLRSHFEAERVFFSPNSCITAYSEVIAVFDQLGGRFRRRFIRHHLPSRNNRNDTTANPIDIPIRYANLYGSDSSPGTRKAPKIPIECEQPCCRILQLFASSRNGAQSRIADSLGGRHANKTR